MASRVLQKGVNKITQAFSKSHAAVDLGRPHITGEPVIAHSAGRVVFCQTGQKNKKGSTGNASYGNCVKIDHGGGYETLYAHLSAVSVKLGQTVAQGQTIGNMGNTGNSYGIHLHFEVRKRGVRIDPTLYLEKDLPIPIEAPIHVSYRVYCGKWLPPVVDYNDKDSSGYAGMQKRKMTALQAVPTKGTLRYRAHLLGKGWLPWVVNDKDFAGIRGKAIDAVQMELTELAGYQVRYRVSAAKTNKWYGWCVGKTDKTGDGYAGVFGQAIDRVQMEIITKES